MEIQTYKLKQDHEEFKDLSEQQLMAIAELCLDYYKLGQYSTQEETKSDMQDEIDELTNQVDDLESKVDCYEEMQDDLIELIEDCYKAEDEQEVKENIEVFANSHKYEYVWDFIDKNDNNSSR